MDLETLKVIVEHSNKINDLAFKLLIASFAIILTTSYVKPLTKKWKRIYWLFIPGWILLYFSINNCDIINRRTIAYKLNLDKVETLNKISLEINSNFEYQLNFFNYSLIIFGIWLLFYMIWFILIDKSIEK